jgi:hypothetical protein
VVATTDPGPGPGPGPGSGSGSPSPGSPPEEETPRIELSADGRQPPGRQIEVEGSCNVGCEAIATGELSIRGPARRPVVSRSAFKLRPASAQLDPGETHIFELGVKRAGRKAIAKALRYRQRVKAKVQVSAKGADGSSSSEIATIRIAR